MESIRRGLASEDDLARRDAEAYHQALHGDRGGKASEVEDMGDIILGDRVENHSQSPAQPSPFGGIGKALLGTGLLATGIGTPLGAYFVANAISQRVTPAPVVQPVEQESTQTTEQKTKIIDWNVGEPIVE